MPISWLPYMTIAPSAAVNSARPISTQRVATSGALDELDMFVSWSRYAGYWRSQPASWNSGMTRWRSFSM